MGIFSLFILPLVFANVVLSQSHSCSFTDDSTGFSMSWTAGIGFVDFFFNYKKFPTRAAYWTGVGFGDETLQVALIESQYGRVSISSAAMYGDQPPLKLPTANMVTRGFGSIDEEQLSGSFSVPIYYFQNCETWSFFTIATQIGMPYSGIPKTRTICNVTNLCITPKLPRSFRQYTTQDSNSPATLNIQIPKEVSQFLDQPLDADVNLQGGIHLNQNGANIRFSPTPQQQQFGQNPYNQQQQFGQNPNQQFGQNPNQQFGQNPNQQFGQNPNQQFGQNYYNPSGYFNNANMPNNQAGFYDTRYPNANSQNISTFTIENPNYKFLPDGLNNQYEANSGRQRFYDNNGNPTGNQFGSTTQEPIRSNADQNQLNYQDISSRGTPNNANNQQFTNNIYGYDYRSNPGSKYTINGNFDINVQSSNANSGNEQQYQPPQTQRFPNGKRKRRQTSFKGTAYEKQDNKFPRVENTIPMSISTVDDTVDFNTNPNGNFNQQRVFYDAQNSQAQGSMYYPYRTGTANNIAQPNQFQQQPAQFQQPPQFQQQSAQFQQQRQFNNNNGLNNVQYDSNTQVGRLAPYYINPNNQMNANTNDGRQFDNNPYSTNNYNPANRFYNQTNNSNFGSTNGNNLNGVNNANFLNNNVNNPNGRFNPATHQDIHQYDDINCQGQDPPFCKDYVKKFEQWFRSYGGTQTQGLCPELKKSLYHTDHHCCQALQTVNC